MSQTILDSLVSNNEIPMLFIGSGISKRYLENYPDWLGLLETIWNIISPDEDFYGYANTIRNGLNDEDNLSFKVNTIIAKNLEEKFNEKFYLGEVEISDFSQEDTFRTEISPFKKYISIIFSNYILKTEMKEESLLLSKSLINSKVIFTTNYDSFIENCLKSENNEYELFIGQKGFMRETDSYAEIYKLHGCTSEPESIILTQDDYEKFDKNSILISAKMISNLLYAPIIFLGYSIQDRNIRNILKQFSQSLSSDELVKLKDRFIVIEWEEGKNEIEESIYYDSELLCEFTHIKTDNYTEIYNKLIEINQGMPPAIIKKYSKVFKQLIIQRGKEGTIETMLIAPDQLDDIESILGNEKFVIALGDEKYVFYVPEEIDYLDHYFIKSDEMPDTVALKFISHHSSSGRIPFKLHIKGDWKDNPSLSQFDKKKIENRIRKFGDLRVQRRSIKINANKEYKDIKEILKLNCSETRIIDTISYFIDDLNQKEVLNYIQERIRDLTKNEKKPCSSFRKLMLIYDLTYNS